ncbi:MAG TPA: serine/threonine-protein kinase [Polyangiaceae bacterium]
MTRDEDSVTARRDGAPVLPAARSTPEGPDVEDGPTNPRGAASGPRPTLPNAEVTGERSESPDTSSEVLVAPRTSAAVAGARSAAEELRLGESARTRAYAVTAVALSATVVVEELAFDDQAAARVLTLVSFLTLGIVAGQVWRATAGKSARPLVRQLAAASCLALTVLTYRVGVFSPAPLVTTLGIAFFGLGEDRLVAYLFTAGAGIGYGVLASLVSLGLLADPGMIPATLAAPGAGLAMIAFVPIFHAATLWHARLTRRATLAALQRSNDWFREARQREVQLEEVNRDLDNLLRRNGDDEAANAGARAGAYVLRERIGQGAMGEVYAAKHSETGAVAAVKLLHPSMQEDALLVQRFLREGAAASKLRGANVVEIFEVGKLAEGGAPYLAMELLRGHDLAWHLRRRGQLSLDEVVSLVEHVAAGLEAARVAGVVHRDLKPQNLFLAQQPNAAPLWKILDFGVSRLADSGGTLTKDVIVGTPGYMSPEQATGAETSHRSDVFSFGAVVYRALTGEPPFSGEDTPQTLYQVVYKSPARPSAMVRGLPPDVDLVLAVAMAKDPADRFESASEMAQAMRLAARSTLDPRRRLQARTLIAALPWGAGVRDSSMQQLEDELSLRDAEAIEER